MVCVSTMNPGGCGRRGALSHGCRLPLDRRKNTNVSADFNPAENLSGIGVSGLALRVYLMLIGGAVCLPP